MALRTIPCHRHFRSRFIAKKSPFPLWLLFERPGLSGRNPQAHRRLSPRNRPGRSKRIPLRRYAWMDRSKEQPAANSGGHPWSSKCNKARMPYGRGKFREWFVTLWVSLSGGAGAVFRLAALGGGQSRGRQQDAQLFPDGGSGSGLRVSIYNLLCRARWGAVLQAATCL